MPRGTHGLACKRSAQDVTPATACSTTSCGVQCCVPRSRPARNRQDSARVRREASRRGSRWSPWSRGRCVTLGRHVPRTPSPHPISRHQQHRQGQRLLEQKLLRPWKYSAPGNHSRVCAASLWDTGRMGGLRRQHLWLSWEGGWRQPRGIPERRRSSVSVSRSAIQRGNAIACRGTMPGVAVYRTDFDFCYLNLNFCNYLLMDIFYTLTVYMNSSLHWTISHKPFVL